MSTNTMLRDYDDELDNVRKHVVLARKIWELSRPRMGKMIGKSYKTISNLLLPATTLSTFMRSRFYSLGLMQKAMTRQKRFI